MRPSHPFHALFALALLSLVLSPKALLAQSQAVAADRPIAVMVELSDPPAAAVYAARQQQELSAASATAAAQAQLATITAAQAMLHHQLASLNTPVLFSVQRVYNGVAVLAGRAQLAAIAQLPGVRAVHPLSAKEPNNSDSIPFLGVSALWQAGALPGAPAGLSGQGMRIAIVDTGVDYLHRNFGGGGTGYLENDHTRIGDVPGYPGLRVAGGYDFAGDKYNASASATSTQAIPQPDPDPMDCNGHGTHVAGTAAGSGVTGSRTTYSGPYDAAIDYDNLHIGPGVTPRASISALKIFGCYGSTNLTDLALEWVVDPNQDGDFADRMDVVNLSLGSAYGWEYDTSAVAANNAALVGVIVVASTGNNGDIQLVTSAPASAERAISVAATQGTADVAATFSSRGPRRGGAALKPDLAAPGADIFSAKAGSGSDGISMSGTSMATPLVSGLMALLRQAHPEWSVEELKALAMNTAMPIVGRGEAPSAPPFLPVRIGAGRIDPVAAAASNVVAYVADGSGSVGLSFGAPEVVDDYTAIQEVELANKSASPAWFDIKYSSLVNLPGVSIQAPTQPVLIPANGRLRVQIMLHIDAAQFQRRQSPADQGSYLLTTWYAEEGGHVYLWPLGAAPTLSMRPMAVPASTQAFANAQAAPDVTAQFHYQPYAQTLAYTVTLAGIDASAVSSATLGYGKPGDESTALAGLLPLPEAGSVISGSLVLNDDSERWLAAGLLHLRLAGDQFADGEVRGQLLFPQPVLHMPVYAAPRPVTEMRVEPQALTFVSGTVQALDLVGSSLQGSTPPTDVVPLAAVMELKLRSPNTRPVWLDANAADRYDHADIRYVGVTSDFALGLSMPVKDARVYFGVATWDKWSTPSEVKINVLLDTDGNGEFDYRLVNGNPTVPVFSSVPAGPLISELYDISSGQLISQQPLNGVPPERFDANPFFSNIMVLPVKAADIGLGASGGNINFLVQTTSTDIVDGEGEYIDRSPIMRYDPVRPALLFSPPNAAAPTYLDSPGTAIQVEINAAGFPFNPPAGVLVLHNHNRNESRTSIVAIDYRWPFTVYLPVIDQRADP